MGWWKADPVPEEPPRPQASPPQRPSIPQPESSCPVDEKTRSIWLQQAKAKAASQQPSLPSSHPPILPQQPRQPPQPSPPTSTLPTTNECSSDTISQSPDPIPTNMNTPRPLSQSPPNLIHTSLPHHRHRLPSRPLKRRIRNRHLTNPVTGSTPPNPNSTLLSCAKTPSQPPPRTNSSVLYLTHNPHPQRRQRTRLAS